MTHPLDGKAVRKGRARSEFIAATKRLLREYREGRGASACMADLEKSFSELQRRLPRNQGTGEAR